MRARAGEETRTAPGRSCCSTRHERPARTRGLLATVGCRTACALEAAIFLTGAAVPVAAASRRAARDGAATVDRWLTQLQADLLEVVGRGAEVAGTAAMGAALLAGVGSRLLTLDQVWMTGSERSRGRASQ